MAAPACQCCARLEAALRANAVLLEGNRALAARGAPASLDLVEAAVGVAGPACRGLSALAARTDAALAGYAPHELVAAFAAAFLLYACVLAPLLRRVAEDVARSGRAQYLIDCFTALPGVRTLVRREKEKLFRKIGEENRRAYDPGDPAVVALPKKGRPARDMRALLAVRQRGDCQWKEGASPMSGSVYMVGKEHLQLLNDCYAQFSFTNPLHGDSFPSVGRMEAEVVAMTAGLVGGGAGGVASVCGTMTSGGSESILCAMLASRDYARETRGIRRPEIVIGVSAHAAFYKAAEYFRMKLVRVPVGADGRLHARTAARYVTRNTAVIVGAAASYPHGVVDDIAGLSALARRRGCLLHVDACLGGFVLPFAKRLGYPVPEFEFSLPGVTSMSLDTHKFGMGHKGTSVVLFRHKALRRKQFTSITDWTGGLYISPSMAGSRSGGVVATAWCSMLHLGEAGYLALTDRMMKATQRLIAGIDEIEGLEVIGKPDMVVVAWKSVDRRVNIYKVNDLMTQKGWHLCALQFPASLHMCLTAAHSNALVDRLVADLRACVKVLKADPKAIQGGMAPMYGMAASMPDRSSVGDVLAAYQDVMLEP